MTARGSSVHLPRIGARWPAALASAAEGSARSLHAPMAQDRPCHVLALRKRDVLASVGRTANLPRLRTRRDAGRESPPRAPAARAVPGTRSGPRKSHRSCRRPTSPAPGSAPPAGSRGRWRAGAHDLLDALHQLGREAFGRLVHQDQRRVGHQGAPDRQHLLLAAAERAAGIVEPLGELRKLGQHGVERPVLAARLRAPGARGRRARWSAARGSRAPRAI